MVTNHQINCRIELERCQRELDEYDVQCEQELAKLREEQKRRKAKLRADLNEAKGADRRANDPRYS